MDKKDVTIALVDGSETTVHKRWMLFDAFPVIVVEADLCPSSEDVTIKGDWVEWR